MKIKNLIIVERTNICRHIVGLNRTDKIACNSKYLYNFIVVVVLLFDIEFNIIINSNIINNLTA